LSVRFWTKRWNLLLCQLVTFDIAEASLSPVLQTLEQLLDVAAVQVAPLKQLLCLSASASILIPRELADALEELSEAAVQLLTEHMLLQQQGEQEVVNATQGKLQERAGGEGPASVWFSAFLAAAVLPKVAGLQTTASTSLQQCLLCCGESEWNWRYKHGLAWTYRVRYEP
jgi:hypothetical protein